MKKRIKIVVILVSLVALSYGVFKFVTNINPNPKHFVGEKLDSLHGVYVFYNGGIGNVEGRNLAADGYNLGLRYQCVEFVKRYYYQHFNHKMPDTYGNAKDFFDTNVLDGKLNTKRDLIQFTNPSITQPQIGDLLIMAGNGGNPYGHVAIISEVNSSSIEIIQQNPGPYADSRATFSLSKNNITFLIESDRILGWLRMK